MQKSFLQSKTLWINFLGAILTVLAATEFQSLLPQSAIPYIGFAVMVINVILRSIKDGQEPIAFATPKTVERMNFASFNANRPPYGRPPAA
jgi:hypothetical protein